MPVDPNCGNCDGRGCMGCVCREYDHDCADDCPVCCPEYGGDLEAFLIAENARVRGLEEDNKRLEALVRAKDETIGELLELIPDGLGEGTWTRIDHLAAEDWRQYRDDIRLGRFS